MDKTTPPLKLLLLLHGKCQTLPANNSSTPFQQPISSTTAVFGSTGVTNMFVQNLLDKIFSIPFTNDNLSGPHPKFAQQNFGFLPLFCGFMRIGGLLVTKEQVICDLTENFFQIQRVRIEKNYRG
jgi:hypothetical protein